MANIAPPDKKVKQVEKEKVVTLNATDKPSPVEEKSLQLKVPVKVKNEFKAYAASRGKPMNDLFMEMYEFYKNAKGE